MTRFSQFTADQFESAIADALRDKELQTAVSLLRVMAVEHPSRCEKLLNGIETTLDALASAQGSQE